MDINQDEIRRQLRAADKEQRAANTGFRDALQRIFHSNDISAAAKGEMMGAPDRRQFLRIGGVTVLGAAVIAACGSSSGGDATVTTAKAGAATTTTMASGDSTTTTAAGGGNMDIVLARTAASLENLAVALYGVALGTSKAATLPAKIDFAPAVVDAAKLFQVHHQSHADALNAVLKDAGQPAYTDPNAYLFTNVVAPKLPSLTTQEAVVAFALDVENIAAGTYAYATTLLSTPQLRAALASIGGVESRHATALSLVLDPTGKTAVPRAFTDASPAGRIPDGALITS